MAGVGAAAACVWGTLHSALLLINNPDGIELTELVWAICGASGVAMAPTDDDDNPPIVIPPVGGPDWCRWVKNECLKECTEMALPTKDFGITFQRCVNQCMFDNDCGGNDSPQGWWPGLGIGPKPWKGWGK